MVNGSVAASGDDKFDSAEWLVRFGDILNREGPLVEIRSGLVFVNPDVRVWQ
jgi:hypothetical protein